VILVLPLIWLIAETFVAVKVAGAIGVLPMLLALIASWPIGIWAMRSQGAGVMRRLRATVAEQRAPAREMLDGALVLLGGLLLIVPGFIGDVFGLVLLVPPTRTLVRRGLVRSGRGYVLSRIARFGAPEAYDVDSTASEVPPPKLSA
jgi:UPF0716 protein FxsA